MKESILHYVWQFKLFFQNSMQTSEGIPLEIIDIGKPNYDAGPDFFNAKIRIDDIIWAGNIEIHWRSSDWNKHGHQKNKAYNNVILHVVSEIDAEAFTADDKKIPQVQLRYPDSIDRNYESLLKDKKWIACEDKIGQIPDIVIETWKNALLSERLQQKTSSISELLDNSQQHWEEAFYITLARNFGFGVNNQPFENLAKSLPLSILGKHKDRLSDIEALLFGQSGLLSDVNTNAPYPNDLKRDFAFLQKKYGLTPIDASQWKLLRLRPDNFPHIRIAQFASLIHSSSKLFSKIIDKPTINYLRKLFVCQPSEYWTKHYTFKKESHARTKRIGTKAIDALLINTVVPFLFCYGEKKQEQEYKDIALSLLEEIPPENNAIINAWKTLNLLSTSAYDSQALLQLKKEYCDNKKCLRCRIGHKIVEKKN